MLERFIAEGRKTERFLRDLRLPVAADDDLQLSLQRRAEFEVCHMYLMAVGKLDAFLKQQMEYIQ